MTRKQKIIAAVALTILVGVADAQFFGTARRVFQLIITSSLEVEGTSDLQGNVSDSLGDFTIADDLQVNGAAAGTIASPNLLVINGSPNISLEDSAATANEGLWDFSADGDSLRFRTLNDARDTAFIWLEAIRSGNDLSELDINAPLTVDGSQLISSANPSFEMSETDQAADEKIYRVAGSGGNLNYSTRTDAGGAGTTYLRITRTGTNVDSFQITADAASINGEDITPTSGSFTATFDTACTTSPTLVFNYVVHGDAVFVSPEADAVSCTSDSVQFQASTDIPAAIRPALLQFMGFGLQGTDAGSNVDTCYEFDTDGDILVGVMNSGLCNEVGWTNSGAKSAGFSTAVYLLIDP